jgi:hypothetical protein
LGVEELLAGDDEEPIDEDFMLEKPQEFQSQVDGQFLKSFNQELKSQPEDDPKEDQDIEVELAEESD